MNNDFSEFHLAKPVHHKYVLELKYIYENSRRLNRLRIGNKGVQFVADEATAVAVLGHVAIMKYFMIERCHELL